MTTPVHSVQAQVFATVESAFNTVQAFAAADSVKVLEITITPDDGAIDPNEYTGSASEEAPILGRNSGGEWSVSFRAGANASASGTAPRGWAFFRGACGGTPNTSLQWQVGLSDTVANSLQIGRKVGTGWYEQINGCGVTGDIEYRVSNAEVVVTVGGRYTSRRVIHDGVSVSGSHSSADTTIDVASGEGQRVDAGLLIKFGTEDNGGSGYTISSIATDTLTISAGLANGLSGGEQVLPLLPTFTDNATTIRGVSCSWSWDGGSTPVNIIEATITHTTGIVLRDNEVTTSEAQGLLVGPRQIRASVRAYYLEAHADTIVEAKTLIAQDAYFRIGPDTSNARFYLDMPKFTTTTAPVVMDRGDAIVVEFEGRATKNSAAADELVMTWN
ncbi:MAG: hypothetical protein ACO4CT_10235 [Planctomycetota bacterium]